MAELDKIGMAIIKAMKALRGGIQKNSEVGSGNYAYKGVADKDVKYVIGRAMEDADLSISPIQIDATNKVENWMDGNRMKSQVFCEVKTKYLLVHGPSGQNITIEGYGHGIDSGDKAAGKATTYAMKMALLYTFMVPTGDIDDTDGTHSEDMDPKKPQAAQNRPQQAKTPVKQTTPPQTPAKQAVKPSQPKPWLHEDPAMLTKAIERIANSQTTIEKIENAYQLNQVTKKVLISYQNQQAK